MKKLKMLAVALGMVAMVSSALAVPSVELVVYDGAGGSISVAVPSLTGTATYVGSDSFWSVVVSVGTSYPPAIGQGTATSPVMDLSITATSIKDTTTAPLNVYFGASEFGPTTATINATISGHVVSGAGAPVTYKTYYSTTLDALPAIHPGELMPGATQITTTGAMPGPTYFNTTSGPVGLAAGYSLEQYISIAGQTAVGSYSLDASLNTTPDGGTTVMLLGAALSGLALLRRKLS